MRITKPNELKPIHLQERDRLLVEALDDYSLLTTEQVRYLLFPSMSRARKRLHLLWQHGLVHRIERPTRLGEGTKSYLFRASAKGRRLTGTKAVRNGNGHKVPALSPLYAEHQIAVNRFRICLTLATKQTPGTILETWKKDGQLRLKVGHRRGGEELQVTIIPDAYFLLKSGGSRYGYFLEVDRGTATISRLKRKLLGYAAIFKSPRSFDPLIAPGFRVLIVTSSARRKQSLLELVQSLGTSLRRPDIFLITNARQFGYEAPEAVFGPIWNTILSDGRMHNSLTLQPVFSSSRQRQEKPPVR